MKKLNLNRRQLGTGLAASALLAAPSRSHAMAYFFGTADVPATGASLYADIETYTDFGIHHTGLAADLATSAWQKKHLEKLGFAVTQSAVPIRQYISETATLTLSGGVHIDIHPQWPQPVASFTHSGPIIDRVSQPDAPITPGTLVMVRTHGNTIDTPENLAQINPAIAAGAGAIIAVSTHESGQYQIGNVSEDITPFKVPVVLAGEKDLHALQAHSPGTLRLQGRFKDVAGHSITGRLPRRNNSGNNKWLIVSTPQSGWTTCGGERGPGVALFRALARELSQMEGGPSLCFTSNSGHEFHNLGARLLHEADELPPPDQTALWLHLGAGFASRAWTAQDWSLTHSDAHAGAAIMVTPALEHHVRGDAPGLNADIVSTDTFNVGEMLAVTQHGYDPAIGLVGYHSHHHVVGDTAQTTAPHLLEAMHSVVLDLIRQTIAG